MNRIINASNAESPWPWIARIGVKDRNLHYCAATIISDQYLLTAEHCFSHLTNMNPEDTKSALSNTFVTFADYNEESITFELQPEKIFFRPDRYLPDNQIRNPSSADLAILQIPSLKRATPKDVEVQAACLPDQPIPDGSLCWVAGWGYTNLDDMIQGNIDNMPQTLQEAPLHKLSADYCRDHSILNIIEDERSVFN